jgi:hypothetical protein
VSLKESKARRLIHLITSKVFETKCDDKPLKMAAREFNLVFVVVNIEIWWFECDLESLPANIKVDVLFSSTSENDYLHV